MMVTNLPHEVSRTLLLVSATAILAIAGCNESPPGERTLDTGLDAGPDVECRSASDCDSGVCREGECAAPNCNDGVQNGNETDVDCGGPDCDACQVKESCESGDDCQSGTCRDGSCVAPSCDDGRQNGQETDVDCGGPDCQGCAPDNSCRESEDCRSGVCEEGTCAAPDCDDDVQNGSETDVDCGGDCEPCENGDDCESGDDCSSGVCDGGQCVAPSCADGTQNGEESAVDCGGPDCAPCSAGATCGEASDCRSKICENGQCRKPTCSDGTSNGDETDVDCGGPDCEACGLQKSCGGTADCSGDLRCISGSCRHPRTCDELNSHGVQSSGVHTIDPDGPGGSRKPFETYCNMTRDGGGWTLVAVVSSDGRDNWTMANRDYFTTDASTFGDVQKRNRDYKNPGIQVLSMSDVMFTHAPSGVWASYHGVGNGKETLGEVVKSWNYPFCDASKAGNSYPMSAGNLQVQGTLCDTDLYFNLGDYDQSGESYCLNLNSSSNGATFGPAWNSGRGKPDGCPYSDSSQAALGPNNHKCSRCPSSRKNEETDAIGFGKPAGLNSGQNGKAENYMHIYVR